MTARYASSACSRTRIGLELTGRTHEARARAEEALGLVADDGDRDLRIWALATTAQLDSRMEAGAGRATLREAMRQEGDRLVPMPDLQPCDIVGPCVRLGRRAGRGARAAPCRLRTRERRRRRGGPRGHDRPPRAARVSCGEARSGTGARGRSPRAVRSGRGGRSVLRCGAAPAGARRRHGGRRGAGPRPGRARPAHRRRDRRPPVRPQPPVRARLRRAVARRRGRCSGTPRQAPRRRGEHGARRARPVSVPRRSAGGAHLGGPPRRGRRVDVGLDRARTQDRSAEAPVRLRSRPGAARVGAWTSMRTR